jgi:hypothetical protein
MNSSRINTSKMSPVPLQQASLCMDCDMITAAHTRCFVCGSAALLNIAKALNGDEYADALQPELATMTSIPSRRVHQTRVLFSADERMFAADQRMGRRSIGELVEFPSLCSGNVRAGNHSDMNTWWGSFRDVAAIVQRAMTAALIVFLMLGTTAKAQSAVQDNAEVSADSSASSLLSARPESASLPSGTSFDATLSKTLDSKKAKPGYPVVARTTQAVQADGNTMLPKGTRIVGHVLRASARANGASESMLAISFDYAILKNGGEIPLNATIQTIAAAPMEMREVDSDIAAGMSASESAMAGGTMRGTASAGPRMLSGAANPANNWATSSTSAVGSSIGSTARVTRTAGGAAGLTAGGGVTSNGRNVIGMKGLTLNSSAEAHRSVIESAGKNVRLERGTHLVLATQGSGSLETLQQ